MMQFSSPILLFLVLGTLGACDAVSVLQGQDQVRDQGRGQERDRDQGKSRRSAEKAAKESARKPDYAAHIRKLKRRLPSSGFHIVVEPPFVVIGDQPRARVKKWAEGTIRWAVEKLKQAYFAREPDHIIDIWLFRNEDSYMNNAKRLFGSRPTTTFGYYSPRHKALVMNISTGGGTLVHEIVHPFVAANFPDCPSWFNEGLGSLYEQSSERGGKIVGLTNWRLAGLQRAIRKRTVPTFRTLTSTTQFYDEDSGTNYSQARYLCFYLQEKKLLRKYYKDFFANRKKDPTGYATLLKVLGRKDLTEFEKEWRRYVLKLRFG